MFDDVLGQLNQVLNRLIGLHRQLLEVVRMESSALSSANLKEIQEITFSKEALIAAIQYCEVERKQSLEKIAVFYRRQVDLPTLNELTLLLQSTHPEVSGQFQTALTALRILIDRISEQNIENREFIESSLTHVHRMKNNLMGIQPTQSQTYTASGQSANPSERSRLLEREA